jgi:hypothetical protein
VVHAGIQECYIAALVKWKPRENSVAVDQTRISILEGNQPRSDGLVSSAPLQTGQTGEKTVPYLNRTYLVGMQPDKTR